MRKILISVIIICCALQLSFAQSYEKLLAQVNTALQTGDYATAIELYESMIEVYEKIPYLKLQQAHAYRLNLQYNEARNVYQSLVTPAAQKYPEILFWFAQMEQVFGNTIDARYYYNRYATAAYNGEFYAQTLQELQRLKFTPAERKIEITRDAASPFFHNYGVSLLNNKLLYNGVRIFAEPNKKMLAVRKKDTSQTQTIEVSHITFAPLENTYAKLFADEFFSYSDLQEFQNQIYVARRPARTPLERAELCIVNENMLQPVENQPFANTGDVNIHTYFSQYINTEIVFFSSNRTGGFGGFDIWYCVKNENGEFGEPINPGTFVNSAGDEICPFFDPQAETLYFSSNWHEGLGGFDIFSAKCEFNSAQPPINWALHGVETNTIQNLGTPINSSFDDFYYRHLDNKAYFTSNRPLKSSAETDYFYNSVFYFDLPVSPQFVLDAKSLDTIAFTRTADTLKNDQKSIKTNDVWKFRTTLFFRHDFPNEQSELNYADEYVQYKTAIDEQLSQLSVAEFSVSNRMEEKQLRDFAENQLLKNFVALQQEIQTFSHNNATDTIAFELQSFTSPYGNFEYNQKLAERRTASVRNYIFNVLQQAGIAPEHIIFYEKIPVVRSGNDNKAPNDLLQNANERVVELRIVR